MHIKLKDFINLVGFGTKIRIIDSETDEVLFMSNDFKYQYKIEKRFRSRFNASDVQCVGIVDGIMYVFVSREEVNCARG